MMRLLVLALVLLTASFAAAAEKGTARLVGRVFERGTTGPLPGATIRIVTEGEGGRSVETDDDGKFELEVPAGDVQVIVTELRHEPFTVVEHMTAGQGLTVEYLLTLLPKHRRRFEATVRGEARHEGERFSLRDDELRTQAGTLGDPFRIVGLLPGVGTPVPLLPIYVIRGASPGMNGYFLDGMRVPQLFHLLLGTGVVHPRLVDRLDFYPGAYDASFGRYAGGIIDTETRAAKPNGQHGEVEVRLFDVSAALEFNLPKKVQLTVAGHYGYPGPIIAALDSRLQGLTFWDYQLRVDWKGLTVEALGSYDSLTIGRERTRMGVTTRVADSLIQTFHRIQIRERYKRGRFELEAAIVGGLDELQIFGGSGVRKLALSARINARMRWKRFTLFGGVDAEISRFQAQNFGTAANGASPDQLGDLGDARDGVVASAFVTGTVEIINKRLTATLSGRADVYHAGAVTLVGLDPRLQLKATLLPQLSLNAGVGIYHQPPSFPIAAPGIDTFALQLGLQRAIHGAVGLEAKLPKNLTLSTTGYYQDYSNANDVVLDLFGPAVCSSPPPESLSGFSAQITRQVKGRSFGLEFLLRRRVGRFTGWVSYTLSKSERLYSCGIRPADYDQSHLLNVVAQVQLPKGFMLSGRLYFATGRPVTVLEPPDGRSTVRNNQRIPDYVQLDLRVDREWLFKRWALTLGLELVNVTYSELVLGIQYPEIDGIVRYDMPQVNGFRWILPSINIRGRY